MTVITTAGTPGVNRFTRSQLLRTAQLFATDPDLDRHVDLGATERTWHRLDATEHLEIWLIAWPVGTSTGWHDHLRVRGRLRHRRGHTGRALAGPAGRAHERLLPRGRGPFVRQPPRPRRRQPR